MGLALGGFTRSTAAPLTSQVVGRGLATHAEIERETIAADFVRGSYEEASDAEAKSLVAAYARLRKMIVRQVEGKAEAAPAVAASASAVQLKQHQQSTGDLRSGGGGDPALDSAAAADSDVPGSGVGDAGDMSASHLGAKAPGAGGDAASVSSESEAAAIESSIRSLEQLAVENDTLRGKLLAIETTLHEQVSRCSVALQCGPSSRSLLASLCVTRSSPSSRSLTQRTQR